MKLTKAQMIAIKSGVAVLTPEQKAADILANTASKALAVELQSKCAKSIASMLEKATATGKKCGGYTASQLSESLAFEQETLELVSR